ncbi:hypothetical protein BaRGS_00038747 [Batillaria attramentaria]|uniref:Uncharacterized protein n=1 Tax=Batillaria attramentaria TaxID=370345 RepID=A0ABD0J6B7_9CAEN
MRFEHGAFHNLIRELQADGDKFKVYFRLTREQFAQVAFLVFGHATSASDQAVQTMCLEIWRE